jgi:predicted permease
MTLGHLARRRGGLSAIIVATLALGIGSATALYSVITAVLLRPFPFRDQDRLVMLWQTDVARAHPFVEISYPDARDWHARTAAFDSIAAMSSVNFPTTLTGMGDPRQLRLRAVAERFFDVMGRPAIVGRTFLSEDHRPGSSRTVVLGFGLWQSLFGGDPGAVGRAITLDGEAHTIVGVMPRDFRFPEGAELWTSVEQAIPQVVTNRVVRWMIAVGRLKAGVSVDEARAALDVTIGGLDRDYRPQSGESIRAVVRPLVGELLGTTRRALLLLLAAVGAVLLIACANVSNLLLSRSVERRREIATRIVLGASRARLARQLLGEVVPLALAGGLLGIGIAGVALDSLVRVAGAELPRAEEIALDLNALAAAIVLSLGTGFLCALAPLLQSRGVALGSALRDDSRSGSSPFQRRMRDALVTGEIALALVLLVGAVLLVVSFLSLRSQDLGFDPDHLLTAELELPPPKGATPEQVRLAQRALLERIRTIPEVESASAILTRPLWSAVGLDSTYQLEGQTVDQARSNPVVNLESTVPDYFRTMRIRILAGRDFTEDDTVRAPRVAIVSESFARSAWPGRDPLGRRLRVDKEWLTVIGVVADVRYREIEISRLDVYEPYTQSDSTPHHVVIRTAGDPRTIAREVRGVVQAIDPSQAVELSTMNEIVSRAMGRWRLNARLFGVLAVLAVLLAAVGTYSVMSYAVSQRRQEIGVRVALGAGRGHITRMILGDGFKLALSGVAIGTLVAYSASGLLRHLLIGIGPHHPAAFGGAALLLCAVAALACLLPARRAAAVDPGVAMRVE